MPFKKNFLAMVFMISYLSVLITGTRGWILGFSLVFLTFLIVRKTNIKTVLGIGVIGLALLLAVPVLSRQLDLSLNRVSTLEQLAEGDITAGGTLQRLDERGPRVMNKFSDHPVFGHGFSNEYYNYQDGHVGNQTLLLSSGIFGYLVFLMFWIRILSVCYKCSTRIHKSAYLLLAAFGGLFIIHSSSRILFNYLMGVETAMGLSLFFYLLQYCIRIINPTYPFKCV
jgi:hypothetical protein